MSFAGSYAALVAFLLMWTVKATAFLGLAFIVALLLRRQSSALRHRVWAIAIAGSLVLPVAALAIPAWHVLSAPSAVTQNVSQTVTVTNVADPPAMAIAPTRRLDTEALAGAALLIWALGTVLVVFRSTAGLARLRRISVCSRRAPENACAALDKLRASFGIQRKVRLLECASGTMMPMTWGIFRPTMVLPAGAAEWGDERRRIVLSHELAHIRRGDWILQISAELLRACFWFQPLAWIGANRLRQESERACDDAVLNSGIAASEYASQLLALAKSLKTPDWRFSLALAIARPSNLERRFEAMLDSSISRRPLSRTAGVAAALLGACLLLPVAALTLSAEAPVQATTGVLMPEAASTVLPPERTASASALLRIENQPTPRAATTRRLSGAAPKPAAVSGRDTSDAQSTATTQAGAPGPLGSISGTVGDPGGARVARASVTLKDVASGAEQQITAGLAGEFDFANLIPDNYELTVQQPGFKIYKQTIHLFPSEELKLPELLLTVGEIRQTVEVSASRSEPAGSQTAPSATVPVSACPASLQAAQLVYKNPVQPGPPPARIRVGGNVEMARLVQQTMPIYPAAARNAGIQGTVVLNGIIGKDGTLLSSCVESGPALLAQSAFDAVSHWQYSPALLNGEPVEVLTEIQVVFTLRD